jgi:hypothetical protein
MLFTIRRLGLFNKKNDVFIFFDIYGYNPFQISNFILKIMNELLGQEKIDFSGLFK